MRREKDCYEFRIRIPKLRPLWIAVLVAFLIGASGGYCMGLANQSIGYYVGVIFGAAATIFFRMILEEAG